MLKIEGLYKDKKGNLVNNITLEIPHGSSVSLECSNYVSDLLVDLVLGREVPARGSIYINDLPNTDYIKNNPGRIGIVPRTDAFYDYMTIDEYLRLFAGITRTELNYKEVMLKLALLDIGHMRIAKLSYTQKRRVSFARERLKQPELLLFQDPILNVDGDSARIIIENIDELCADGTSVLLTSVFFKDTVLVGDKAYRLDAAGLVALGDGSEAETQTLARETKIYKLEKIPAKVEGKILLFEPKEIDYVESEQGLCNLFVRGEKFSCNLLLTDLEERLTHFGFFRCHRSYLVNLQRVREIITWSRNSYSLILEDKQKSSIPLSKGRLDELKEILNL